MLGGRPAAGRASGGGGRPAAEGHDFRRERDRAAAGAADAGRAVAADGRRRRVPAGPAPSQGRRVRRTEDREPPPARAPQAQRRHEVHARQTDTPRQEVSVPLYVCRYLPT